MNASLLYVVVSGSCLFRDTLERDPVRLVTKGKGRNLERVVPEFARWYRSQRCLQETERVVYKKNQPILGLNDCVSVLTNANGKQTWGV